MIRVLYVLVELYFGLVGILHKYSFIIQQTYILCVVRILCIYNLVLVQYIFGINIINYLRETRNYYHCCFIVFIVTTRRNFLLFFRGNNSTCKNDYILHHVHGLQLPLLHVIFVCFYIANFDDLKRNEMEKKCNKLQQQNRSALNKNW